MSGLENSYLKKFALKTHIKGFFSHYLNSLEPPPPSACKISPALDLVNNTNFPKQITHWNFS